MVVKPSLAISVTAGPERMASIMGRYWNILVGSAADEEDVVNIRIACSALNGELSQHPMIQGLEFGIFWVFAGMVFDDV